jgi:hypothetical protein
MNSNVKREKGERNEKIGTQPQRKQSKMQFDRILHSGSIQL